MKSESERIADQLWRAFEGEAWHGPSLREALEGVDAETAQRRSTPEVHSIWELVTHLAGWEEVIARRLRGEALTEPPSGDFPSPAAASTEADWQALVTQTFDAHARLVTQVASADLDLPINGKPYKAWFMLHGAVAHVTYHVGQIVVLRRLGTT